MGGRFLVPLGALAITVAVASLASAPVAGQAPSAAVNTTSTAQKAQKCWLCRPINDKLRVWDAAVGDAVGGANQERE